MPSVKQHHVYDSLVLLLGVKQLLVLPNRVYDSLLLLLLGVEPLLVLPNREYDSLLLLLGVAQLLLLQHHVYDSLQGLPLLLSWTVG